MALANHCAHVFKMIKSDNTLIQWHCNLCHSGPHWWIFECRYCKIHTCRACCRFSSLGGDTTRSRRIDNKRVPVAAGPYSMTVPPSRPWLACLQAGAPLFGYRHPTSGNDETLPSSEYGMKRERDEAL
ncbi:hypothetical protein QBC47DRAFT_401992 [Echria macrotheca]|uniref:Uncharacterized protein n=1 Tax=Echria macrotheca TaxID=438768 RepID=A0AAJ0BCL4_9PEZI|nr:hypothetical protein QBC47DRAFT_401992 [Echria macrotheca]